MSTITEKKKDTSGKKLGVVKKGTVLSYQGEVSAAGWYLIEYQGRNGWVSGKYSKTVEE